MIRKPIRIILLLVLLLTTLYFLWTFYGEQDGVHIQSEYIKKIYSGDIYFYSKGLHSLSIDGLINNSSDDWFKTSEGSIYDYSISRDSERLALLIDSNIPSRTVKVYTKEGKLVGKIELDSLADHVEISPNGDYVAISTYGRRNPNNTIISRILIFSVKEGKISSYDVIDVNGGHTLSKPAWKNNSALYFSVSTKPELYQLDIHSGNMQQIKENVKDPVISPTGNKIAYLFGSELVIESLENDFEPVVKIKKIGEIKGYTFSPDEKSLLITVESRPSFFDVDGGRVLRDVYIYHLKTSISKRLLKNNNYPGSYYWMKQL